MVCLFVGYTNYKKVYIGNLVKITMMITGENMENNKGDNDELVFFNFRVPKELKKEVKRLALENELPIQDMGEELLKLGIKEFKKQ